MPLSGRCRCGAVSYTLEAAGMPSSYACHCLECQTISGSAFTIQVPVKESRLHFEGELIDWQNKDSKGNVSIHRLCAVCKTRLYSTNVGRPGIAVLRGGTLANSDKITPTLHTWIKRKQPWIGLPADTEAYEEAAPVQRMLSAFASNFA